MATFKTVTLALALIAGATSLAIAQNGPATPPPAGGGAAASSPSAGGSGMAAPSKTMKHKTMKKKKMTKPQ